MTNKINESRLTTYRTKQNATPMEIAVAALEDKKGLDIKTIELKDAYTDALVIVTGGSAPHVQALADNVELYMRKAGMVIESVEGTPNNQWVLVDTGDVVVHIFANEMREHYNIEKLYAHDFDEEDTSDDDSSDLTGS